MAKETNLNIEATFAHTLHQLPVSEVYQAAGSSAQGLTQAEAGERLLRYGRNAIREVKGKPLYLKFLANFTHLMALLLWVGGAMAFVGKMPQLGWAVWAVVVINAIFSFWQEFRAEKATEALKRMLPSYVRVLRDGQEARIFAEELVPGDVMLLAEGDHISADARLVEEAELRVDQSTLSGESRPVRKTADAVMRGDLGHTELPDLVFAGTSVAAGTGRAVVAATGMSTEFGKIANLTQTVGDQLSPLQKEVNRMTRIVTIMAVGIGLVFFVLSVLVVHRPLSVGFIFAVGMIVAFVPEGLLPTVTLSLAMGVQRMAKRGALIKKLSSVETLGSTTVICTDKTGTLTQNEMTVRDIWLGGHRLSVTGVGYAPEGRIVEDGSEPGAELRGDLRRLLVSAGLCNNSRLLPPNGDDGERWTVLGDPTEAALRVAAAKGGLDLMQLAAETPRLRELPFESRRKRMSAVCQVGPENVAHVKGAPKEVLALCSSVRMDGEQRELTDELRRQIMAANDDYARGALRVLAVADRQVPVDTITYTPEAIETDMTFLGLMAMMDPPRPEVSEAVQRCHQAGIRIVMVTGDYGLTAETIARRIGIVVGEQPRIVTGSDLAGMDDAALNEVMRDEVIFARVAPEDKLRVVSTLKDAGQVVAVTGDGVNDAPALKKADIGVAMGIAGTDVAREAADMILTDDNFASIVNAIEEGRAVYANIKKFTTYVFTSNMPEAWPFILQILFNIPLALVVMQVLAVDLGTDLVPALALGTERPEPGVMNRPPRNPKERIIDKRLLIRSLLWLGTIQTALCFAGFFYLWWSFGYRDLLHLPRLDLLPYADRLLTRTGLIYVLSTSIFHAGVITTQIGNAYACRTERTSVFKIGFFSNRFLLVGFLVELALISALVYIPVFQHVFEEGPLPLRFWGVIALYPPIMFFAEESRKWVMRRIEARRASKVASGHMVTA